MSETQQIQVLRDALKALLVAIDCGKHEAKINRSNPLSVQAARRALALVA